MAEMKSLRLQWFIEFMAARYPQPGGDVNSINNRARRSIRGSRRRSIPPDGRLDLLDSQRFLPAQDAVAVGRDEHVLLVAQAAEVLVGLDAVIVDMLRKPVLGPPLVDQLGDEVDAGFNGDDESRPQGPGETQRLQPNWVLLGRPS